MRRMSIALAMLLVGVMALTPGRASATGGPDVLQAYPEAPMDCTFTIKGNFNGTVVNVTITVSNVSYVECLLLKAGVKKAM